MDLSAAVLRIAEANGLTQSNVRQQLAAALCDAYEGLNAEAAASGMYFPRPWLVDIIGDDAAGFVVYSYDDDLLRAPYTITVTGESRSTSIGISQAQEVMPRTSYDLAEDVVIERKGKPAKAKGKRREAAFVESIEFVEVPLKEASPAKTDYKIKVIQAGKGSSAFYPKEVLQRDGPKVFTSGTKMYWDHPTMAEEAARPEGSLNNLAAVLTSNAYWDDAGAKGPGLYATAKVFADFADRLAERADNIGVSIRAYGEAKPDKANGLTLTNFTRAESIDFVTQPGAGGAVLTESAKANNQGRKEMDEAQVRQMISESVSPLQETIKAKDAVIAGLNRRANLAEATAAVTKALQLEPLPDASRKRVSEALLVRELPLSADGTFDAKAFGEAITAEVKREAEYIASITGRPAVVGMGAAVTESEAKAGETSGKLVEMVKRQGAPDAFAKAYANA